MSFKWSKDAKQMFDRINTHSESGKFQEVWDFYYYCAIVGMTKNNIKTNNEKDEFYRGYSTTYAPYKFDIVGALIAAEINRTSEFTKDNIQKMFNKYIDLGSPLILSQEGLNLLDAYADGGFELIQERNFKIRDKFEFICTCKELINEE